MNETQHCFHFNCILFKAASNAVSVLIHSQRIFCCCVCAWHSIVSIAVEIRMKHGGRDGCGGKKAWKRVHVAWKHTVDATLKVNSCLNKEVLFLPLVRCFLVPF